MHDIMFNRYDTAKKPENVLPLGPDSGYHRHTLICYFLLTGQQIVRTSQYGLANLAKTLLGVSFTRVI